MPDCVFFIKKTTIQNLFKLLCESLGLWTKTYRGLGLVKWFQTEMLEKFDFFFL